MEQLTISHTPQVADPALNVPSVQCKMSSQRAPRGTVNREQNQKGIEPQLECVSCVTEHQQSDTILLPCSHNYRKGCVIKMFELFIQGASKSPPHCCGELLIRNEVADVLGLEMAKRYEDCSTEFTDPNKLYCSNPACARYILPGRIRHGAGLCEYCLTRTCVRCGVVAHLGLCPDERTETTNIPKRNKATKRTKSGRKPSKTSHITKKKRITKNSKAKSHKVTKNHKIADSGKINSKVTKNKRIEEHARVLEEENSKNDALLERLMKRRGWKRCRRCKRAIERIEGCREMM